MSKKRMNFKLIIFDMDGLMFDSEKISWFSWHEAFKEFDLDFDRAIFEDTLGLNSESTRNIFINCFGEGLPYDEIKSRRDYLSEEYIDNLGIPIKKGLVELLDYLKSTNMLLAIGTSANRVRTAQYMNLTNMGKYFDLILCGDQIKESKPNPEIYLKVAEQLNISPSECLVLEDSENGILAAKNAGMKSIIIPDLKQPKPEILDMSLVQLNNLSEVKSYLESCISIE